MLRYFRRYASVGMLNTALHWSVFALCLYVLKFDQALSNFIAFSLAVTFSFFVNARYTFNVIVSPVKYILYLMTMGGLSISIGALSDNFRFPAIVTLVLFSGVSLILGFVMSRFIIFKDGK